MKMRGFRIAPDDLLGEMLQKEADTDSSLSRPAVEKKTDISAICVDLLPETGKMQTLWLPVSGEGKFHFENAEDIKIREGIYFIVKNGAWHACAVRPLYFEGTDSQPCHELKLLDKGLIRVENAETKCEMYIHCVTDDETFFYNYQMLSSKILTGTEKNADIQYLNPLLRTERFTITATVSELYLEGDMNHVRINGKKCVKRELELGDVIYWLGLRIIVGIGFFSINDRLSNLTVKTEHLRKINSGQYMGFRTSVTSQETETVLYNRLPRRKEAFEPKKITIEAPPISLNSNAIPMILRMGGSMVMGGASALSGNYLMLLSSVLFPVLTQKYTDKEKKEYEEKRITKYREYLRQKQGEITAEKEYEENVLRANYPKLEEVLTYPAGEKKLWERRKSDEDFLNVRIGNGSLPLFAEIEYPEQRFNMEMDILEQEMYALAETPVRLKNVPIQVDLVQNYVCSIAGNKPLAYAFAKRLLMMITILHSYDEVKVMVLAEARDLEGDFAFVKYIPHVWDNQKNVRFIATDAGEAYQIGEVLSREIEHTVKKPGELKEILRQQPYYMVFALSKKIFDCMEILKEAMQQEKNCGVSVITAFNDMPKECMLLFDIRSSGDNAIVYLKDIARKDDHFKMDRFDPCLAEMSMKKVANTYLKTITQAYSLPKTVTFLEMYHAGRVEHLNITGRWKTHNPVTSLAVPVGIATDGSLFYLDLHQKYQGPHGLVAGTTGSGKSELLITYILSLAINFHPDEVAFVLIDYKGGGLAGAFDDPVKGIHLPHLIGTITNLDGASIQRSLVSIESELKRRQKVFHAARSLADEGTMDIYTYQKLYRDGVLKEPMPHLFIISDEFAELKQQQPEFMEQLISAARIGRSLGVHLILATQKPAGVVNDQIRSNTKFRICLKVQDKTDSQDMLKRPEAAELKETGRFYLQVGYNEFFSLGQSAWSGADYEPQDEVVVKKDESVQMIDAVGQIITEVRPEQKKAKAVGTQLMAIVRALTEISEQQNIQIKQLWKPALARQIDIEALNKEPSENICCRIGLLDDPEHQEQYALSYDLEQCQHLLVVGESGSGKTTLLQSLLFSVACRYSQRQVNYYVLDYSSRMLKKFDGLPHCGAVLLEEDADLLDAFFEQINEIVAERKRKFSMWGVDSYTAAKHMETMPLILIVIDNISGLSQTKQGDSHLYKLQNYMKDGLNYGIKYIVSCSHLNDLSTRIRQEFGDRISLRMKDKYEYGEVLNCRVSYTPPEYPGRGLVVVEGRPLEIQTAMAGATLDQTERNQYMTEKLASVQEAYGDEDKAKRLKITSGTVTYDVFAGQFGKGRLPLGIAKKNQKTIALPLRQLSTLCIYQGAEEGTEAVLKNFLRAVKMNDGELWFMQKREQSRFEACTREFPDKFVRTTRKILPESGELENIWREMADKMAERIDMRKNYWEEHQISGEKEMMTDQAFDYMYKNTRPWFLVIENQADFCQAMDNVSAIVFSRLFQAIRGLNIYLLTFYAADDPDEIKGNHIYAGFDEQQMTMLFGGKFDKQAIVELPPEVLQTGKQVPFNVCLMKYRNAFHVLAMPCGEAEHTQTDPDSQNIFI